MADVEQPAKPVSPISNLLQKIGLTRDDLSRHSDQMRQFLTTQDAKSLRAFSADSVDAQQSIASVLGKSRSCSHSSSNSRQNASVASQTPPPSTPVKSEPVEPAIPLRHMDSMEMILERKSRKTKRDKRGKKDKERNAPSPSPASTAFSLDAFMHSRDSRRVPSLDQSDSSTSVASLDNHEDELPPPPVTPQHRKYYRDYDTVEHPSCLKKGSYTPRDQSPTPTRHRSSSIFDLPHASVADTSNANFITPRRNAYYKSPLPSSSPPQSSPFATPSKPIVNLVSSPGPMGPLPDEDDYENLPYTLPPGPYSMKKPDLSYAALIGQAIISSPDHRLTLQELYDWITIVYPYYNRSEMTWMNSIRHVLSTTVCFRKVPRDRSVGRTLWAIWDCDLECFADGGFRKEFCAEIKEANKKSAPKKRAAEESVSGPGRKTKRQKKGAAPAPVEPPTSSPVQEMSPAFAGSTLPTLVPYSQLLPLFPPRSSAHHQPYYQNCVQLPTDVIFPPLPPSSSYARTSPSSLPPSSAVKSSDVAQTSPIPPSSLPALSPSKSSSSPRLSSEDHLFFNLDGGMSPRIESTPPLESGITLLDTDRRNSKARLPPPKTPPKKSIGLPPMPVSPTLDRRGKSKKAKLAVKDCPPPTLPTSIRPMTPPPRPSTPPRRGGSSTVQLSPIRTPLSHKGLHMSPSASLAHYKFNLDPPPSATFRPDDGINPAVFDTENIRTPSRKRGTHAHGHHHKDTSILFPPVTPKKLVFPTHSSSAESPFRTPGSKSIFDPHDPGAILDEELARLGAKGMQESPIGLFEGRRGLLYESPNMPSPGKWARWF
ncbi:hypothetical protein DEU56DRAFT_833390 [Suillus clintonianus]|uniref:uncharacterized protein n=1 Tax=Suillus clintonianus TaxID=1904413 RepID=UPI001B8709D6|nr:uncharacterized protein DEU56DRAFT_833390 [Suillus clintonianus]KAG2121860.1 hypothetical protein DEU56DRAFT_833390 [Suillus clintonianus]